MVTGFGGLKNKEKLIKVYRKHPITLVRRGLKSILFFVLALFFLIFLGQRFSQFANWINIVGLGLLIISLTQTFYGWVVWYYDSYVLTNLRIIEIDQRGMFQREVKELPLSKIEDVKYKVSGFLETIFEVGTVRARSTGGMEMDIVSISDPKTVRELIISLRDDKNLSQKELTEPLVK